MVEGFVVQGDDLADELEEGFGFAARLVLAFHQDCDRVLPLLVRQECVRPKHDGPRHLEHAGYVEESPTDISLEKGARVFVLQQGCRAVDKMEQEATAGDIVHQLEYSEQKCGPEKIVVFVVDVFIFQSYANGGDSVGIVTISYPFRDKILCLFA